MAKVSTRNEHDWVMVTVKFADGVEARSKWNRGGADATVTPRNPAAAKTLFLIAEQAAKTPGVTIGLIAEEMGLVGAAAADLDSYLDGLKTGFGVSGEQSKLASAGPDKTEVTVKQSRGWVVAGTFPSGETFDLKVNKSSVGLRTNPMISSRDGDLMNTVFSIKNSGIMVDSELAERIKEAAEESSDIDGWVEAVKGIQAPAPRR